MDILGSAKLKTSFLAKLRATLRQFVYFSVALPPIESMEVGEYLATAKWKWLKKDLCLIKKTVHILLGISESVLQKTMVSRICEKEVLESWNYSKPKTKNFRKFLYLIKLSFLNRWVTEFRLAALHLSRQTASRTKKTTEGGRNVCNQLLICNIL